MGSFPTAPSHPERPNVRRNMAYGLRRQDGGTRQMKVLFLRLTPFVILSMAQCAERSARADPGLLCVLTCFHMPPTCPAETGRSKTT